MLNLLIFIMTLFSTSPLLARESSPHVVVIGAGLAGLTTAYRLQQQGMDVQIYEARGRAGGRVLSAQVGGTIKELGGQNINDGGASENILKLIDEFKLELQVDEFTLRQFYYDDGKLISVEQLLHNQHFDPESLHNQLTTLAKKASNMRDLLRALFNENDPLFKILAVKLAAYEGGSIDKLSASGGLETLYHMLLGGWSTVRPGNSEGTVQTTLFSIKGGNQLLTEKMAGALGKRLHLKAPLLSVAKDKDHSFVLTFKNNQTVKADILVLAIPCTVYKDITFDHAVIPKGKLAEITSIQYGTNAKVIVPLLKNTSNRTILFSDHAAGVIQNDSNNFTLYYVDSTGIFSPSTLSAVYKQERPMMESSLGDLCPPFRAPVYARDESFASYEGTVGYSWHNDPYARGSYSFVAAGQEALFTDLSAALGEEVKMLFAPIDGNLYFAGEHASILLDIGGTMEAACESGERTARMVLKASKEKAL